VATQISQKIVHFITTATGTSNPIEDGKSTKMDKGKLKKKERSKVKEYVNVEGIAFFVTVILSRVSLSLAQ
jgi:hypothetical protein